MTHGAGMVLLFIGLLACTGCDRGPTDEDMAGCTTSTSRAPTARDVANCAIERSERNRP